MLLLEKKMAEKVGTPGFEPGTPTSQIGNLQRSALPV